MHELQQILLTKLPRLWQLTFWCEVIEKYPRHRTHFTKILCHCGWWNYRVQQRIDTSENEEQHQQNYWYEITTEIHERSFDIIGHKPSHADILEALGEDWAMTSYWQLLRQTWVNTEQLWLDADIPWSIMTYPRLPQNLSDLSLPEYEETRKQLISLLK